MKKDYATALEKATATLLTEHLYDEGYVEHVDEIDKEALLQVLRDPFIVKCISENEGMFSENLLYEIYREHVKLVDSKKSVQFFGVNEVDARLNDLEAGIHAISQQQAEIMDFLNRMSKDLDKVEKKVRQLETKRDIDLLKEVDREEEKENNKEWRITWTLPRQETTWGTTETNSKIVWSDK